MIPLIRFLKELTFLHTRSSPRGAAPFPFQGQSAHPTFSTATATLPPRTHAFLLQVTAAQLDLVGADLWLLTPPCQPHTRTPNARRRDTSDPRAASLLHLLSPSVFPAMKRPPSLLILENVPGFVGSDSHGILRSTLAATNYDLQEFVVSPHQLGVPYSRYVMSQRPTCSTLHSRACLYVCVALIQITSSN